LLYTRGNIVALVTMYAINVFVTFSLSQAAMLRYWWRQPGSPGRKRGFLIHGITFLLTSSILVANLWLKLGQGAWMTVVVTGLVVALAFAIRAHYRKVQTNLHRLNEVMNALPTQATGAPRPLDPKAATAVLLVGSYGGLGIHTLLTIQRLFPGHFKNFLFVSVGVVDSATMKGVEEVDRVRDQTQANVDRYVDLARRLGLPAEGRMSLGTEAVAEAEKLAREVAKEYPRAIFFAGKLVFERERWYQRFLHNETAYEIQRRLQFEGLSAMVLPVRVHG
ncbi:MAG TPA: amino acid transporter, partial [Anaeromyxobacteraceae bacterium]|nr:amino acid transporter [Anaeromyxobacteraceae bacterium]